MKAVLWPSSVHPTSFQFADLMHLHITLRVKYFFFLCLVILRARCWWFSEKITSKVMGTGHFVLLWKIFGIGGILY